MLKGIAASDGYGIGKVLVVKTADLSFESKTSCDKAEETKRYETAVAKFCEDTQAAAARVRVSAGEKEAEIITGHILMIQDPYMDSEIRRHIDEGECAESAVSAVCDMFIGMFGAADEELIRQRATDVADIKTGVLSIMLGRETTDISAAPAGTVLVADDLTPSMTSGIVKQNIAAIITQIGGRTSHSAILARAMEIPAVLSVPNAVSILSDGTDVIVDGCRGEVIAEPTGAEVAGYSAKRDKFNEERAALVKFIGKPTVTADGAHRELVCNVGKDDDIRRALEKDGEGIGLFRTEFMFMDKSSAPSEDEQFETYKKAAVSMKGKPVIIRTLDIGGDKDVPYLGMKKEQNPFLGFRAVRFCLHDPEFYKTQLRAIIRASAFGDVRIMIPLVTNVEEVRAVRRLCVSIMKEFSKKGIEYNKDIKIGVMTETPAAAIIADLLASEADFFSIGTNDLTQYTMAVDRGNPDVAYLYSTYDPAVLRSVKRIIDAAHSAGIPVGMCGEAAADKKMIPLLISFGLDEFSVNPASVLEVRKCISQWNKKDADELTEKVMSLPTQAEVLAALEGI